MCVTAIFILIVHVTPSSGAEVVNAVMSDWLWKMAAAEYIVDEPNNEGNLHRITIHSTYCCLYYAYWGIYSGIQRKLAVS